MMELLAFPPHRPVPSGTVALHLALMTLGLLSLFRRGHRPAAGWEPVVWVAVLIVALLIYATGTEWGMRGADRPFLIGYMLFSTAVSVAAGVVSCWRLVQQGRGTAVVLGVSMLLALGLLILLSFPFLSTPREVTRRSQCRNNLKQLGLAFHNWYDEFGCVPDAVSQEDGGPDVSWRVVILPYIDYRPTFERYDRQAAWDTEANLPVAQTPISTLMCPSRFVPRDGRDEEQRYLAAYTVVRGPKTLFPDGTGQALNDIADGASTTAMIVETCGLNLVWTQPKDVELGENPVGVNLPGATPADSPSVLSSYHLGISYAGFADGSVRAISEKIDPRLLKALLTASGGEQIEDMDF